MNDIFLKKFYENKKQGILSLRDPGMTFPALFDLMPQIDALRLYPYLTPRSQTAVAIARHIACPSKPCVDYLSNQSLITHTSLRWMLKTGCSDEDHQGDFEKILDITAAVLLDAYQDKDALPFVEQMIFTRGKKGRNVHNLVWAFFRIRDMEALQRAAEHIRSDDPAEARLACKMLNLESPVKRSSTMSPRKVYEGYLAWLSENESYLYFTGESFQFSKTPEVCRVDHEKKRREGGGRL